MPRREERRTKTRYTTELCYIIFSQLMNVQNFLACLTMKMENVNEELSAEREQMVEKIVEEQVEIPVAEHEENENREDDVDFVGPKTANDGVTYDAN